jgi:SMC interacting uncharacterized protein involved in chromosome segregation
LLDEQKKIYKEGLEKHNLEIEILEKDLKDNNVSERNEILEASTFLDVLRNASTYYKKANYVQKRKISKILFSNIVINNKKRLTIKVKPNIECLFCLISGDDRQDFEQNIKELNRIPFVYTCSLLHFYSDEFNKREYIISQLTHKQRILYRFDKE